MKQNYVLMHPATENSAMVIEFTVNGAKTKYTPVASLYLEIDGQPEDYLEKVYMLTNHIDHDWTKNPEVAAYLDCGLRSSMIGDLVSIPLADGKAVNYIVATIGFEKVEA